MASKRGVAVKDLFVSKWGIECLRLK
jgi:hypothetical protein